MLLQIRLVLNCSGKHLERCKHNFFLLSNNIHTSPNCFIHNNGPAMQSSIGNATTGPSQLSNGVLWNHKSLLNGNDTNKQKISNASDNNKAKLEQLLFVKEKLGLHLPNIFKEAHPYALYTADMIFENFLVEPPKISVGILQYAIALLLIRSKVYIKYSFTKVQLLSMAHSEKESIVQVRWRIMGVSSVKTMLKPWRFKIWSMKESMNQEADWIDGISIFHVNNKGLIWKHRVDRVITEKTKENLNKIANLDVSPV